MFQAVVGVGRPTSEFDIESRSISEALAAEFSASNRPPRAADARDIIPTAYFILDLYRLNNRLYVTSNCGSVVLLFLFSLHLRISLQISWDH